MRATSSFSSVPTGSHSVWTFESTKSNVFQEIMSTGLHSVLSAAPTRLVPDNTSVPIFNYWDEPKKSRDLEDQRQARKLSRVLRGGARRKRKSSAPQRSKRTTGAKAKPKRSTPTKRKRVPLKKGKAPVKSKQRKAAKKPAKRQRKHG